MNAVHVKYALIVLSLVLPVGMNMKIGLSVFLYFDQFVIPQLYQLWHKNQMQDIIFNMKFYYAVSCVLFMERMLKGSVGAVIVLAQAFCVELVKAYYDESARESSKALKKAFAVKPANVQVVNEWKVEEQVLPVKIKPMVWEPQVSLLSNNKRKLVEVAPEPQMDGDVKVRPYNTIEVESNQLNH